MTWQDHHFPLVSPERFPYQLAGLGENTVDMVLGASSFPAPGEKQPARSCRLLPGGQIATALTAGLRLGLSRVRYIGKTGGGPLGEFAARSLRESGLECELVGDDTSLPHISVILVDPDSGERSILAYRDPALAFHPGELPDRTFCCAPVLLLDGHDPEHSLWCARQAKRCGIRVVLDLDRASPAAVRLLEQVDFPLVSRSFLQEFTGMSRPEDSLASLAGRFPGLLIVTLGSAGAAFWREHGVVRVPAWRVQCLDSTGAGDVFHAGFIYGLLQGWPLGRIIPFANAAAAINCTAAGARGRLPGADEVLAFMARGERHEL